MAQVTPLYDRPDFFNNYLTLPRQQKGHDGAPEWPSLREMVGPVENQRILDLGCGLGWFARYAIEHGAKSVEASDISTKMIAKAKEMTPQAIQEHISYQVADLNDIDLDLASYDLVYSSLTLHYLSTPSLLRLLRQIHKALKPNGRLVFSVEHPIYTAPDNPEIQKLADGSEIWPLNRYADESLRETTWLGGVKKYHHTMTSWLQGLMSEGYTIRAFREWMATGKDVRMYPEWSSGEIRPIFLLLKAVKEGN